MTGKYLDSVQTLRKYQEIINTIRHIDATDIKSLSTNVSSSWPTVKSAIEELANNNLIRVPNGNDVKKFIINPDFACFLGIAIGATETKISIIDFEFKPIDILNDMYFTTLVDEIKKIYPVKNDNYCLCFDSKLDYFEIYKFCTTVIDLALDFFQQNSICNKLHLLSVGISLPGIIDKNTQEMTFCPNIPSLVGMPVKKILSNETREKLDNNHIPFYIYRDSMAATVGEKEMLYLSDEKKKQYKNKENIAVFYLGYGLSSGYIFNNQLILGASGATGEIGHICIDIDSQKVLDKCNDDLFIVNGSLEDNIKLDSIDNDCDCSSKLCLERLVRLMVFNSFSPNDYRHKTKIDSLKEFSKKHSTRYEILKELLGKALNITVNMLNVDLVILSGRILNGIPELRSDLEATMNDKSLKASSKYCNIINGSSRLDIVAIGVAILSYYNSFCDTTEDQSLKLNWNTNLN